MQIPENRLAMPNFYEAIILKTTSTPPYPPHWQERYKGAVDSLKTYNLFPVGPNTSEYDVIAALLYPTSVSAVEQIVNPSLWSRFVNTRKEMLKTKSNDSELLSKLELNDAERMVCYQHNLNFETDPKVLAVPYNDSMALLFHCTRSAQNVGNILSQGLDERMGVGGLLGRGIYFSDDPQKSMQYDGCDGIIFIFAVLLGDCVASDEVFSYVREPEKSRSQKRNVNDLFFDSIVGGTGDKNEYVIYNR